MQYLESINKNEDDQSLNLINPRISIATNANKDNLHYRGTVAALDKI